MRIQISRPDSERHGIWFNERVGEVFEVMKVFDGIPRQYIVDISHLKERGEMTVSIAYVPFAFAEELVDSDEGSSPFPTEEHLADQMAEEIVRWYSAVHTQAASFPSLDMEVPGSALAIAISYARMRGLLEPAWRERYEKWKRLIEK